MATDESGFEVDHLDATAGEFGVPVDAVCTGCLSANRQRNVRIKRASLNELGVDEHDAAEGGTFRHVCHRCQGVEYWNVVEVLNGLIPDRGESGDE